MSAYIGYLNNEYPTWGGSKSIWNCSNNELSLSSLSDNRMYFFYEFNYMLWEQWDYLEFSSGNFIKMNPVNILIAFVACIFVKLIH